MKILMMSNSPLGPTAYSHITRYMSKMFQELGHEVNIFAYWGIDSGHPLTWNRMQILPRWRDPWGKDIFIKHMMKTQSDILMPIFDVWVMPQLAQCPYTVAYSPTDHDPPSEYLRKVMEQLWKVIPFTAWSKESLEGSGLKNTMDWIPHGIDLNLMKPLDKTECRKKWLKPEDSDAFVVGVVAGNYDKEGRKRWDKFFEACKYFKEQNPKAKFKIFAHTDVSNVVHGFDLPAMTRFMGLEDIVYHPDPYYYVHQLPYERMAEIYSLMDVHMLTSSREGFGMPILESQACGVPSLATDFSAGKDHTHKDLRVKVKAKIMTPIISWTAVPDAWDAYEKLQMLYDSPDKLEKYKKWSLKNSAQYDWNGDLVRGKWIRAFDYLEDELKKRKDEVKRVTEINKALQKEQKSLAEKYSTTAKVEEVKP